MTAKFVHRYHDSNRPGDGAPELRMQRRIVVKESAHYVWHMPLPYDYTEGEELTEDLVTFGLKTKGFMRARKTRKDAHRSAWRLDRDQAMADWLSRKYYQLSRMRLQMERVENLLDVVVREGIVLPQTGSLSPEARVIMSPPIVEGEPTPECDNYCWSEY